MLRKKLAALLAAAMMLLVAASPAWADAGGNFKGWGNGAGGGDGVHPDQGKKTRTGGGAPVHNPH